MPEPTISYPGRDALRISAAKARENANGADVARAALAALDAQAHDLAALVARLDAIEAPAAIIRPALSQMLTEADEPDGPPCAACGLPDSAPAPSARCPFEAFHEDGGPPPVDRVALADTIHGEPTGADFETGRDLARMAEADGAISDGADVPYLIAQALAAARADGYRRGIEAARR